MDDDDLPLRRNEPLTALTRESLDPLSLAELDERIAILEAEIARTRAHKAAASSFKASAEALFRKG